MSIEPHGKPGDQQAATQRVVRTKAQPSGVVMYVLPGIEDATTSCSTPTDLGIQPTGLDFGWWSRARRG